MLEGAASGAATGTAETRSRNEVMNVASMVTAEVMDWVFILDVREPELGREYE